MRRAPLALPLALLAGVLLLRAARAEEWADVRDAFREASKSPEWAKRRDAFLLLVDQDRSEAVQEILAVIDREPNAAVVYAGLETLGLYTSEGVRTALVAAAQKGKDRERLYVLVALEKQVGPEATALLLEVAKGRDAPAAAQAALALGAGESLPPGAGPALVKLLAHRDWQVRCAAARSLARHPDPAALPALAAALADAKGRDRADLIAALEKTSGQAFGNDPAAWRRLAAGEDAATIQAKPVLAPTAFGIPIYGRRVVIVLDNSLRMSDPHPFDGERLRTLCDPPDGAPIPWFRMKTNAQFAVGHVKHLVRGLERGTKVGLILYNLTVNNALLGLVPAGSAAERQVDALLDDLIQDDGIATFDALDLALDLAGPRDATAWKDGPDEILLVTVNMPTAGEVREADVVAAAIGLKARARMVPIHVVGISFHPYDMCRALAERTGGTYVSLVK